MTGALPAETKDNAHVHHAHHQHDACGCGHDHGPAKAFDTSALISARGLTMMRGDRVVLDHVDVDIHPREIVTLIGPNGSGKTTLVRALLGLQDMTGGEISRMEDLRIGYVPQRFDIDRTLPMTVSRFLSLGHKAPREALRALLEEVGAERCFDQQLSEISGGELQRVLLARALAAKPDLLVLDEPVRGVDYTGEADLYALIGQLRDKRGIGVLLVSHDLHVVMASSDRVLCLNRHICCSGVPETVAQHPEYMRLFGAETARAFGVYRHHHDHAHGLDGRELPVPTGASPAETP
jgi:zinc transport system ATP-binding protein